MTDRSRVTDVGRVPADGSFLFSVRGAATGEEREAILVRVGDGGADDGGAARSGGEPSDADPDDGEADDADESDTDADHADEGDADTSAADPTVRGWLNYCRHLTHVRLDKGGGAPMRGDEILCTNHGAMFAADSGRCTFGPCEGAYLEPVAVTVDGDGVT